MRTGKICDCKCCSEMAFPHYESCSELSNWQPVKRICCTHSICRAFLQNESSCGSSTYLAERTFFKKHFSKGFPLVLNSNSNSRLPADIADIFGSVRARVWTCLMNHVNKPQFITHDRTAIEIHISKELLK